MRFVYMALAILGLLQGWILVKLYTKEKIAYVDSSKLMSNTTSMQEVRKAIQLKATDAKLKLDTLGFQFESELKKHEQELASMGSKEKKVSEHLLNMKRDQVLKYREAMQNKIGQEEQKMTAEVLKSINSYISNYGKEQGYTIILATVSGNIAYADNAIDVTDQIVEGLNKK